jgi:drug/metabolite transporter (DMT)-like permease
MVAISRISKDKDPVLLTILQFGYAGIISWVFTILFEDIPKSFSPNAVFELLYLAVFATAIALLLQNIGQKYTKPAPAAIILSLEAVFGVIFSVIFYKEEITAKLFLGFLLIFIAIITSETKWAFLRKKSIL